MPSYVSTYCTLHPGIDVRVRISPSSDVIATWNPGIDGYALGQTHRNLRIARTYPFDIANGVYVEDLSIQYK